MSKQIFRKVALERLSSPDQLDQMMQATRPLGWIALVGCFILLAVAVFWGFFGEIPSKVTGQGIILKRGSIHDVVSLGTGQIQELFIETGATVQEGQVLAVVAQPGLDHELNKAKKKLSELQAQQELITSLDVKTAELKKKYLEKQRASLKEAIVFTRQWLVFLEEEEKNKKTLFEKGISTQFQYQQAIRSRQLALQDLMNYRSELNNLSAKEVDLTSNQERGLITIKHNISIAIEKIKALEKDIQLQSRVTSPQTGRVLEIFKHRGQVLGKGEALLSLEDIYNGEESLSVAIYFTPLEGKRIHPGMTAHIAPSTIKIEESGFILGNVQQVSSFPSSQKGMLRVLGNMDLVRSLSAGGAPIMVTASLIPDPQTISGYKWSSKRGPSIKVQSGTMCGASVVVDKQRPVSLALPYLKKNILGIGEEYDQDE